MGQPLAESDRVILETEKLRLGLPATDASAPSTVIVLAFLVLLWALSALLALTQTYVTTEGMSQKPPTLDRFQLSALSGGR